MTARVRLAPAGSRFEAEWLYIGAARRLMPREYRALMDRWRAWYVHVDLDEPIPRLRKVDLAAAAVPVGSRGVLLGPMRDKDSAGRYMEHLTDLFDLCRDERLLAQAPNATACPYKEMGRCAAPCDGSETIASYRARVEGAARFGMSPIEREAVEVEERMQSAASGLRFEEAAALKRVLDRMEPFRGRSGAAFVHVGEVGESRWVIVGRSEREGWARLFACAVGLVEPVADLEFAAGEDVFADAARAVDERLMAHPFAREAGLGVEQRDGLALVCRWLRMGEARRMVRIQRVGKAGLGASELAGLVRSALKPAARAPEEEPAMELEGMVD